FSYTTLFRSSGKRMTGTSEKHIEVGTVCFSVVSEPSQLCVIRTVCLPDTGFAGDTFPCRLRWTFLCVPYCFCHIFQEVKRMVKQFSMELAGRTLTVEIGRVAAQANGAAFMHYGDTVVLSTATASDKPREGIDFFPLSVEFEE